MAYDCRQNVFDGIIAKQVGSLPASEKLAARTLAQPYAIKLIVSRCGSLITC